MKLTNYTNQNTKFCLELERVQRLIELAGNPDKNFKIIHIAGTNGKGSVGAFLETGLSALKIKCGRFASPHLFSEEDSITIGNEPIKPSSLAYYVKKLKPLSELVKEESSVAVSPFEMLFVAALLYFSKKKCQTVILECGMGGLGDATNAISQSDICVFTSIDYDHTDYLGTSLAQIAKNKCGILREGCRVYSAVQYPEAEDVIVKECRKNNCSLTVVNPFKIKQMDFLNIITDIGFGNIRLSMAGLHQSENVAIAAKLLKREFGIEERELVYTLTHTKVRARLEEITKGIYFDGAHNLAGVKSLINTINAADIKGKLIFVLGFMADKDISSCLDCLKRLSNKNFEIYTCTVHSNRRSAKAEDIRQIAKEKGYSVSSFENIRAALKKAKRNADVVFAFGSLYMYKELFKDENR